MDQDKVNKVLHDNLPLTANKLLVAVEDNISLTTCIRCGRRGLRDICGNVGLIKYLELVGVDLLYDRSLNNPVDDVYIAIASFGKEVKFIIEYV